MKKLQFYTRYMIDGSAIALLVRGYTDGTYNYYKNDYGTWCAIHPLSGLAIPNSYGRTRKNAVTMAHNYTETINKNITIVNHQSMIFQNMIQEAQKV